MRISDWSSDVCSSDLQIEARHLGKLQIEDDQGQLEAVGDRDGPLAVDGLEHLEGLPFQGTTNDIPDALLVIHHQNLHLSFPAERRMWLRRRQAADGPGPGPRGPSVHSLHLHHAWYPPPVPDHPDYHSSASPVPLPSATHT